MGTNSRPFVTVAIASDEDEDRIEACIRDALAQEYPAELEVVVADAMSMDATREIVLRLAAENPRVRFVENPERTRACAMNAIIHASRGEIVVPMDPRGSYAKTHVARCVTSLLDAGAEQLAILPRTQGRTFVERALSAAQKTRMAFSAGAGLSRGSERADALLGAIRKRILARSGLFDPDARIEEDAELSDRIRRAGGQLVVPDGIVVYKSEARTFRQLFRRHYLLGKSRGHRVVKERRLPRLFTLTPVFLVACGGALLATSTIQPLTPLAFGAYALATGAAAVRVGRDEGVVAIPIAWAAFPIMHAANGVGFGAGVARSLLRRGWRAVPQMEVVEATP